MKYYLYSSTGFNAVNIPDSVATLTAAATAVVSGVAIDCLQSYFLRSITVKQRWETVKNVDYARVDDFFYFVSGITMTSHDVCRISLTPDFITSAGGIGNLTILDGITERHHVAKSADTFGAYTESDPLLVPSKPLNLAVQNGPFMSIGAAYWWCVESSIDLYAMGETDEGGNLKATYGVTFTDQVSGGEVTVPKTTPTSVHTTFYMGDTVNYPETSGTAIYNGANEQVQRGIQLARDLGIEDAIIAQYALPRAMFQATGIVGTSGEDPYYYATLNSDAWNKTTALGDAFNYEYATVKNRRVLYGENNRYGILSAAGNSAEYVPEDIHSDGTAPTIVYRGDPRQNGKPYYNYRYFHGVDRLTDTPAFFRNAVAGMEWRNIPLRFVSASKSIQDSYAIKSQLAEKAAAYEQGQADITAGELKSAASLATSLGQTAASASVLNPASFGGAAIAAAGQIAATGIDLNSAERNRAYNTQQYETARNRELYNFNVSQSVVTPVIKFPFQEPSIRDYCGNGCIAYRYYLSDFDIAKLDRILTAYGYRDTALLTADMFKSRSNFNYVKASGVTVGGSLPHWWKDGISDQFSVGVRVWHVKPDSSYYSGAN